MNLRRVHPIYQVQYPRISGLCNGIYGLLLKVSQVINRIGIGDLQLQIISG